MYDNILYIYKLCRFTKWLQKFLNTFSDAIEALGLIISEIGSHSFRKGIASILANCPGGPGAISIWLRAGWSLGPVQSRYIFQGAGGDQFAGRAATMLDINDVDFAILPPHFDLSDPHNKPPLTLQEWESILPGYSEFYPAEFKQALPYLLASLIYHMDFLRATLSRNHPLFQQRVYTSGIEKKLKPLILNGHFSHPVSRMKATGIPIHVLLNKKLNDLQGSVDILHDSLAAKFQELKSQIPQAVCDLVLAQCQVNGAVPITAEQVSVLLRNFLSELQLANQNAVVVSPSANDAAVVNMNGPNELWTWGGALHMVPESFHFPKCNVRTMWDLWWVGNPALRIQSYRKLRADDLKVVNEKKHLVKARAIMTVMCGYSGEEINIHTGETFLQMSSAVRDAKFALAFQQLCAFVYKDNNSETMDQRRVGEYSYLTFYDLLNQIEKPRKKPKAKRTATEAEIF